VLENIFLYRGDFEFERKITCTRISSVLEILSLDEKLPEQGIFLVLETLSLREKFPVTGYPVLCTSRLSEKFSVTYQDFFWYWGATAIKTASNGFQIPDFFLSGSGSGFRVQKFSNRVLGIQAFQ